MGKEKKKHVKLCISIKTDKLEAAHQIKGIDNAYFPYEAYPEQITVIQSIRQAIKNGDNALIESPTGTGKTLCLLVGALSTLMSEQITCKKIYYLTRTHSQINQVITEFKKTVYDCKVNIIASREQLCVNPTLSQLKGKTLDRACAELCLQKLCVFKENSGGRIPAAMQLKEFKEKDKKQLICPFFHSKQLTDKCEITILPFNYLLDCSLFERNQFDLKDSVIIFDEAHNIDAVSEQGSTIDITSDLLYQAINELRTLIKSAKNNCLQQKFDGQNAQISQILLQLQKLQIGLKNSEDQKFYDIPCLIEFMEKLTTVDSQRSLQIQGIDLGNIQQFIAKCKTIAKQFYRQQVSCDNFQTVINLFERLYATCSNKKVFELYSASISTDSKCKGIRLRCLDPAVSFRRITTAQPRSIILSSGTLGSLAEWQKALGYAVKVQLSITSFITPSHLHAQIIKKSQNGRQYDFSYNKKHIDLQYEDLVEDLKQVETRVDSGIVVAFSNYQLMEKTLKNCHRLKKKVFFESKNVSIDQIYQQYSAAAQQQGAFLFIIIKGRFSEGINFEGGLCRCLVVVGIPYLPMKDAVIVQKMKFIECHQSRQAAQNWYMTQTFKSLNQTLGRVIRSKKDYGTVLLVDHRYQREDVQQNLSSWFQNCLRKSTDRPFEELQVFLKGQSWKTSLDCHSLSEINLTKAKKTASLKSKVTELSTPVKRAKKKLRLDDDKPKEYYQKSQKVKRSVSALKISLKPKSIKRNKLDDNLVEYLCHIEKESQQKTVQPDNDKPMLSLAITPLCKRAKMKRNFSDIAF